MQNRELLQAFIPMVDFLAEVLGESCEVILHDVTNPEHSVIAIRNGHHSGRTLGSSMTDLAFTIYSKKQYDGENFLSNYRGYSQGKEFVSSTFYIKNNGQLVGMLCVNSDTSPARELKTLFENFMKRFDPLVPSPNQAVEENLNQPLVPLARSLVARAIEESGVPPERMTMKEKVTLVQRLNEQGIFLMKGAVVEIAKQLHISEPTVYRYLNHKAT